MNKVFFNTIKTIDKGSLLALFSSAFMRLNDTHNMVSCCTNHRKKPKKAEKSLKKPKKA